MQASTSQKLKKVVRLATRPRVFVAMTRDVVRNAYGRIRFHWSKNETGKETVDYKVYQTYDTYLAHQRGKLKKLDLSDHDERYRAHLVKIFQGLDADIVTKGKTVLCLAARIGTEVKAFLDRGCFAIGIDLNPGENNHYVVSGDFHHLQFPDQSVDIVFTNSLDHAFNIPKILGEVKRVLKPTGHFILEIIHGTEEGYDFGFYEAARWKKIDDVVEIFAENGFQVHRRHNIREPWSAGGEHISFILQR